MLNPHELITPPDLAAFLKVSIDSVYQSVPGKTCRPKLGRALPQPIRVGRLLRWTGSQINEWIGISPIVVKDPYQEKPLATHGRLPGRPRKLANAVAAQGGAV